MAVLFVAHGSRRPEAARGLLSLARRVSRSLGSVPTGVGFLELSRPTVEEAARALHRRGARAVVLVPLLLHRGRHAAADLPRARAATRRAGLATARSTEPLFAMSGLADVIAAAARRALQRRR